MTFKRMAFNIVTLNMTVSMEDTPLCYHSLECHSAKFHSVKFHSAKCHSVKFHSGKCHSAEH